MSIDVEFGFANANVADVVWEQRLPDRWVALRVDATFDIHVGERLLLREELFPIVELRVALVEWVKEGRRLRRDFEFVSIDSDESGLVWFRKEAAGWRVGALYQEYPEMGLLSEDEVRDVVDAFAALVDHWAIHNLRIDPYNISTT